MKGDNKKQLRLNHQKGHVDKDGVYNKHTEIRGKKKPRQVKTDKPMKRPFNPNQPHMGQRSGPSKPLDFNLGALHNKGGVPKIGSMPQGAGQMRPQQIGAGGMGNLGNIMPPSRPPPAFGQPPSFGQPGGSMPQPPPFKGFAGQPPIGGMPPLGGMPSGMIPPSGMPPKVGGMPQPGQMPPPMGQMPGQMPPPSSVGQMPPQFVPKPPQPPPSSE